MTNAVREGFRQCMAWLHTWTGLVTGWILFFVFVTGTAGYFQAEITRWMRPELPLSERPLEADRGAMLERAMERLATVAPGAAEWRVTLPHRVQNEQRPLSIAWEEMPERNHEFGRAGRERLDPATGLPQPEVEVRDTGGGRQLYVMHYVLHYLPSIAAVRIVGVCTMLMLLAIVTGVITHKKIFSDFFTFRSGKGQRSWLDAHNVLGVLALPFFVLITYSGLVFFLFLYMPAARDAIYGTSDEQREAYFEELEGHGEHRHLALVPLQVPVASLLRRAEAEWGQGRVAAIEVAQVEGEPPYIEFRRTPDGRLDAGDTPIMRFHAQDGSPLPGEAHLHSAAVGTQAVLFALHEGRFADAWLRWLYFVAGLLGCGMIATGLVLWTVKRRPRHARNGKAASAEGGGFGLRLVEVLNVGTIAGLPLAVAAYFWANRLLPLDLAGRGQWEVHSMFLVWGWTFVYGSLRPIRRAWVEILGAAAAAYALLPLLNLLTTDRHLGVSLPHGDWVLAGFDLTMFGLAALFACMAVKLRKHWLQGRVAA